MAQKIMIQTKSTRFFVHKKNLPMLIEFAKTFKAKLALVEVANVEITELEEIPTKFCNQNFEMEKVEYEELEVLYPKNGVFVKSDSVKTRAQILQDAKTIKKFIKDKFCNKGVLSLKELKNKFKDLSVTDSCLSNHMTKVRKELSKTNEYKFELISKGEYKCSKGE